MVCDIIMISYICIFIQSFQIKFIIILHFLFSIENRMNNLCFYVLEISKIQDSIAQNKLSISQVQALWTLIDINRKGSLDLNDVYELAGKVTEEQLFAIFKWLDAKRSGSLTLSSLQESIGDRQSTSKNHHKEYLFPRFYAIIDSVKDRPKLMEQIKWKFNFTEQYLRSVYQSVCNLIQSKYISQGELITVFKSQFIKNQLNWNESIQNLLKNILPANNISESKFIQCFCTKISKNSQYQVDEECLLNDSPTTFPQVYKEKETKQYYSVKRTGESEPKQSFNYLKNQDRRQNQTSVRTPTYNNFINNEFSSSLSSQAKTRVQSSPIRQFANDNGINEVLNSIKERRQRLREDSKERKQLIDNVLQRKRQLCGLNDNKICQTSPTNAHYQIPYEFRHSFNQQKSAKSYLNPHPKFINIEDTIKEVPIYRPEQISNQYDKFVPTQFKNVGQAVNYINKSNSQARIDRNSKSIFSQFNSPKEQVLKTSYHKNFDINEILKKYATINRETPKNNIPSAETASFKPLLSKSKSGYVLENHQNILDSSPLQNERYFAKQSFLSKSKNVSPNNSLSILTGTSGNNGNYKQNVMRKAEQQASKKIEQIERKARMKVLEKKGAATRFNKQQRQWGKLIKNIRPNS